MNFTTKKNKFTSLISWKFFAIILLLSLCVVPSQLQAQNSSTIGVKVIKGIVIDELNEPMIGVNVMEKGVTNGTVTDINGRFQLTVKEKSILVFSYIGYMIKEVTASTSTIKIELTPTSAQLDELIVVGYAQQSKKSVVGAVAQTSGENLKSKGAVSNLIDALNGTIPGVTIMSKTGAPGGGGVHGEEPEILIRGVGTWNNTQPLILIDGVERPMSDISVDEIENFSVLKDASATAVYGVKGANGVILITTKRGRSGKAMVSAEVNFTMKTLSRVEKPLGSYEGLLARNYALINELPLSNQEGWEMYMSPRILGYYRDGIDPEKYTNVDWQDVMLRDQAYTSKYSVNVSGGTDFVKYFTSLSYLSEGDILNTGNKNPRGYTTEFNYNRVNFRTNLDFSLTKSTTFKVNLSGYYGVQQAPQNGVNTFWGGLYMYSPNTPLPIYADGTFGADDPKAGRGMGVNYYYSLVTGGTNISKRTALTSDIELEQKLDFITKGFSIKGRLSFDNYFVSTGSNVKDDSHYVRKRYNPQTGEFDYNIPATAGDGFDFYPQPLGYTTEKINSSATQRNMYYEIALNYNRRFGKHNVGALALFTRQEYAQGSSWPSKREDWVGRITYDYDGKYLFETNAAYNGSEKFGPEYKFDFFPSFAIGWRISEESFIKESLPFISNLKLRYSIGWVGSDNLGANASQWGYITTWNGYTKNFVNCVQTIEQTFGNGMGIKSPLLAQSFIEGTAGNPDLRWEKARKQNIGVEFGFFNELLSGTVDYFRDYRYDMLIPSAYRTVPDFFGQAAPSVNSGEVKVNGWEIDLKARKKFGDFNLWGSYSWTVAKNKILFREDAELLPDYQKKAGFRIDQTTVQIASEFANSWDNLYTGVMGESNRKNFLPGSVRKIDYNADGIINSNDDIPYGYSRQPQNTYGFGLGGDYKGISLMLQFYGVYNATIDGYWVSEEFFDGFPTTYKYTNDRTATPEYGVKDPSYRALGIKYRSGNGNYQKLDASMLRLKTIELSYAIPQKWLKRISVEKLRLFVNGNNLWLWSKLPIDVEGKNYSGEKIYPATKNINIGLNITL